MVSLYWKIKYFSYFLKVGTENIFEFLINLKLYYKNGILMKSKIVSGFV